MTIRNSETYIVLLGGRHNAAEALHLQGAEAEGEAPVVHPPGPPGPGALLLCLPVHPHGPLQPKLGHILLVAITLGVLHAVQGLILLKVGSSIFGTLKYNNIIYKTPSRTEVLNVALPVDGNCDCSQGGSIPVWPPGCGSLQQCTAESCSWSLQQTHSAETHPQPHTPHCSRGRS